MKNRIEIQEKERMIGIVILNYQTWELTYRCVKSVFQTCSIPFRIYLVDNASVNPMPDTLVRQIDTHKDRICFLQAEENRGYSAGMNLGIKKALEDDCEYLLLSNNDIVFQKGSINKLVDGLAKNPGVGIAGPKVLDERGQVQTSRCSKKTELLEIFQIYTAAKYVFRKKWKRYFCLDQDPEKPSYVYHVSGCCFAISRTCAKKITPLDEGTFLYHEELIIGRTMEKVRFFTLYKPESVVVHRHGATAKGVLAFTYQCRSQSELYYCRKYLGANRWQLWLLYQYRKIVYLLRCVKSKELWKGWKTYCKETKKTFQELGRDSD